MALPSYSDINDIMQTLDCGLEAAESHGVLCGLLCAGQPINADNWLPMACATPNIEQKLDDVEKMLMKTVFSVSYEDLNAVDMPFNLLLPDDNVTLRNRQECLAPWLFSGS